MTTFTYHNGEIINMTIYMLNNTATTFKSKTARDARGHTETLIIEDITPSLSV